MRFLRSILILSSLGAWVKQVSAAEGECCAAVCGKGGPREPFTFEPSGCSEASKCGPIDIEEFCPDVVCCGRCGEDGETAVASFFYIPEGNCTDQVIEDVGNACMADLNDCRPATTTTSEPATTTSTVTNVCDECNVDLESVDIAKMREEIEEAAKEFETAYSEALGNIDCNSQQAQDAASDCQIEIEGQMEVIEEFMKSVEEQMQTMEQLECIQNNTQDPNQIRLCPYEDVTMEDILNILSRSSLGTARKLNEFEEVLDFEGGRDAPEDPSQPIPVDITSFITEVNVVSSALAAAQALVDNLPECGGFFTGDACSGARVFIQVGLTLAVQIVTVSYSLRIAELQQTEDLNDSNHFFYSRTNYFNIQTAHDKLDTLLCPFGDPPIDFITLGQGCDAIDQNCDCEPDDCSEDKVPPTIELKEPIPTSPFRSTEEAELFLVENIETSDDCAFDLTTHIDLISEPDCTECIFRVTVSDVRCVDVGPPPSPDTPGEPTTVVDFVIMVDSTAAEIKCGFFTPQDKKYISGGWHPPCPNATPPFPDEGDILHIDFNEFEQDLVDVMFWYQIETDGEVSVEINLLSNELEIRGSSQREELMGFIIKRQDVPDAVQRAEVFLAPFSCKDRSKSACKVEHNPAITTRFYDIKIIATDPAGNTSEQVCSVAVIPRKGDKDSKSSKSRSSSTSSRGHSRNLQWWDDDAGSTESPDKPKYIPAPEKHKAPDEKKKSEKGKGKGKGKGGNDYYHDPDAFRREFKHSTQRYIIANATLVWNFELDTDLHPPPLPDCKEEVKKSSSSKGKGKGDHGKNSESLNGSWNHGV